MHITALRLANFRNYEHLDFRPTEGLNVLVGPNAQGKSTILEAIFVLAASKSHRTSNDSEMIRVCELFARCSADVNRTARTDINLEVIIRAGDTKMVKLNSVKRSRVGDIVGQLNAVIFSAADVDMVKGEPARRRRFLNLDISQVSPAYIHALGRYKRALDHRNNLLKNIRNHGSKRDGLSVWTEQTARYGAAVIARRMEYTNILAGAASRVYESLSGGADRLTVTYKSSLDIDKGSTEKDVAESFSQALAARVESDISRGTTGVGPHRDDLLLSIDGLPAREYASQGQQRTAAIALRLAEIDLVQDYIGEPPVVMLDDVMGELDEHRRAHVLDLTMCRCQTFLTTVRLGDISEGALHQARIWNVESGEVRPA